jgi:hypothetical protein
VRKSAVLTARAPACWRRQMAQTNRYGGGCHCGKVRYRVTADLAKVISCNCSICSKKGHLLAFVPADQFRLERGEGEQTDYLFNQQVIHHLFCKTCGIESYARGVGPDGKEMVAINVRCLDDVDLGASSVTEIDGKVAVGPPVD